MAQKRSYYVRPRRYRGQDGFHVGSRGGDGWPVSIFVSDRSSAELIRDALVAREAGHITTDEYDAYEWFAFFGDDERR